MNFGQNKICSEVQPLRANNADMSPDSGGQVVSQLQNLSKYMYVYTRGTDEYMDRHKRKY
jgi:hypothetical protein